MNGARACHPHRAADRRSVWRSTGTVDGRFPGVAERAESHDLRIPLTWISTAPEGVLVADDQAPAAHRPGNTSGEPR